jgi:hypothetical protein
MTDFGAGPYLTQDLDWEVTNTGDIRTTQGTQELQKDIALFAIAALQPILGQPESTETRGRMTAIVNDILNADPRVDKVVNVNVRFIGSRNEAEVVADVITDNSEQQLVFEVDR